MDKRKKLMKMIGISMVILLSASSMTNIACNVKIDHQLRQSIDEIVLQTNFTPKPHVVVALLDSGTYPYHEVFSRPYMTQHPSTYIEGYPKNATAFYLGDNYWKDREKWKNLEEKKLYWFPGTNIIGGISFSQTYLYGIIEEPGSPIIDEVGHGTGTSSVVVKTNPEVLIPVIECGSPTLEEALSWAINQSWIDVISFAKGWNQFPGISWPQWKEVPSITKRGVENGKIIINGVGNRKIRNRWIAPWTTYEAGPSWIITVGGVENCSHGKSMGSAKYSDYVSNFTQYIASLDRMNESSNYRWASGTSLSAPTASGTFSSIILEMRQELNYTHGVIDGALINIPEKGIRITNWDIRDVVNHTAIYWKTTDWNPGNWPYKNETWPLWIKILLKIRTLTIPINPFAPWLQMSWGYVNAGIVNESVDVLLERKDMPKKPPEAVRYMEAIYKIREMIWGSYS